ncbi:MAG: hypothetical protein HQ522_19665 [Bacteroidetes bacterium]|nr:hypothetical protein [Bacteroidota bacterium]
MKLAKQGDLIQWDFADGYGELSNKTFTANVVVIDHREKAYVVYAEYGQDLIPFDKAETMP